MTPEDRIESPESEQPPATSQGSRRRLLRGGLAAAPALLTLVNRPVMATGGCFNASISLSANMSRGNTGAACRGRSAAYWSNESSFQDWPAPMAAPGAVKSIAAAAPTPAVEGGSTATVSSKNDGAPNPSTLSDSTVAKAAPASGPTAPKATTFDSVFGRQGGYPDKTLVDILSMNTNSGRDGLARHLVAAYLNVLKGLIPSPILDVPTVKNIWASVVARGYYEPTAGIRWFPDHAEPANKQGGIIAWLQTTMPN